MYRVVKCYGDFDNLALEIIPYSLFGALKICRKYNLKYSGLLSNVRLTRKGAEKLKMKLENN